MGNLLVLGQSVPGFSAYSPGVANRTAWRQQAGVQPHMYPRKIEFIDELP